MFILKTHSGLLRSCRDMAAMAHLMFIIAAANTWTRHGGDGDADDLAWVDLPQGWHQQAVRIVDHPFSTLAELRRFGLAAKKVGPSRRRSATVLSRRGLHPHPESGALLPHPAYVRCGRRHTRTREASRGLASPE